VVRLQVVILLEVGPDHINLMNRDLASDIFISFFVLAVRVLVISSLRFQATQQNLHLVVRSDRAAALFRRLGFLFHRGFFFAFFFCGGSWRWLRRLLHVDVADALAGLAAVGAQAALAVAGGFGSALLGAAAILTSDDGVLGHVLLLGVVLEAVVVWGEVGASLGNLVFPGLLVLVDEVLDLEADARLDRLVLAELEELLELGVDILEVDFGTLGGFLVLGNLGERDAKSSTD